MDCFRQTQKLSPKSFLIYCWGFSSASGVSWKEIQRKEERRLDEELGVLASVYF